MNFSMTRSIRKKYTDISSLEKSSSIWPYFISQTLRNERFQGSSIHQTKINKK
jgi:hypothetical protein